MSDAEANTAGVIAPPPAIFAGGLVIGLLADWLLQLPPLFDPNTLSWAAVAGLAALGIGCAASALRRFRAAGTPAEPWKPTRSLATDGIYRRTRNPMYLGMALLLLAVGLGLRSMGIIIMLPLVILVVDRLVIAREERYLTDLFGDEYERYRTNVRRWF